MNDFQKMLVGAIVRHVLTALAGFLVANGFLPQSGEASWIEATAGIVIGLVGVGWSWWQKNGHAVVLAKLKARGG